MASNPMGRCCIVGVQHEGTPRGQIKQIDNNGNTHHAIVIMTDVFGMDFPNVQLIADQFAANGYLTVIPDVFNGTQVQFPAPTTFNLEKYIATTMPQPDTVDPIYARVINHLRGELGVKRLGGVGYCFGGKYVCRWLKQGALDAGFMAHPSFVHADEVKGIQGPLSIAAAEIDDIFTLDERRQTEDLLTQHTVPYQIFLYSGVEHGFATKGDLANGKARFAKEQAFFQAVCWLDGYVKRGA
ncbi:uncharacterized protein SETTUDRAFT_91631 [Exserohilum turcica Et28A]|uniref:Dienelactone hydrolase domain-containing protein n=1 Tax=Exserohilum turcicum (strain 28A) TaxID=671987 RepID=R0JVI9_EXST2|nr:uncharacterized protein SETTUDRAFT_91631 [Exserohilum turcica Et28A]EOA85008.1 hypothetical protein SETTUDRAFT_91631 [Exserohilum turcica Et28A]